MCQSAYGASMFFAVSVNSVGDGTAFGPGFALVSYGDRSEIRISSKGIELQDFNDCY